MRMFVKSAANNRAALLPTILCACAIGLLLFHRGWCELVGFDALSKLRSGPVPTEAVVITMDESTFGDAKLNKGFRYPEFNRATHAEFLDRLKKDGVRLVVFDIWFSDPQTNDTLLATAITNHGNVVIASGELEELDPQFIGFHAIEPTDAFLNLPGCKIGIPEVDRDVVRTFPLEVEFRPSLARAAAEAWGVAFDTNSALKRWVAYYGDRGELPIETYQNAARAGSHPAGYYKGKAVFIGGKPKIKNLGESADEFSTPLTRWTGEKMRGVEVHTTMFLNLIRNEWVTRLGSGKEVALILSVGMLFGWLFTFFRPAPGLVLVGVGVFGVTILAILFFWTQRVWFNWLVVGWVEIPLAWATSSVIYSRVLSKEKDSLIHEKESLQKELLTLRSAHISGPTTPAPAKPLVSAAEALANVEPVTIKEEAVEIEQYELLKKIGEGAFGQVWLANDRVGAFCAVKVIYRKNFSDHRPFEREFEGVRNFAAISRRHAGWVPILHVGIRERAGFFYYVMEPADDMESGQNFDPEKYSPKTLGKLLIEHQYLAVEECIRIGIDLADALGALHAHHLVHRDIKPSNIIFANNRARLADIGLVTRMDNSRSLVGTEGFIPQEGPGTPVADIFSLGRVLFMAVTGCPPDRHPELPTSLGARKDARDVMRLMEIINKACARFHGDRHQSAMELHDELVKLRLQFTEAHV